MAAHIPGPLYFQQLGATGTPMVFLHSTPDDHRFWVHQTAHFSAWFRCIAIDQAGYGRSPAVQSGIRMSDQAEACWEAVDRVSSGPVIIHGNSMGSSTARWMCLQHPERTLALILSGTGYRPDPGTIQQVWKKRYTEEGIALRHHQVLDHFSDESKKNPLVQHYANMVVEMNNLGTVQSIILMNEALSHGLTEAQLATIGCPTLIMSGTADRNHATSFELQKRIKGSALKSIEGAGHAIPFERPWEYDANCIEFLKKHGLYPGP